jgi:RNA polymerase primary sigma factor
MSEIEKRLLDALDKLPDRERKVLILRFGIGGGSPRTLEEVGRVFNVTRQRIREIEGSALHNMRRSTVRNRIFNGDDD